MSPIGNSPASQEGATGDRNGGCTYNQLPQQEQPQEHVSLGSTTIQSDQGTIPGHRCQNAHRVYQTVGKLGRQVKLTPIISVKSKRNSEQRKPGRKTLMDFFPIIIKTTTRQQLQSATMLEAPDHQLRSHRSLSHYTDTTSYNQTKLQHRASSKSKRPLKPITQEQSSTRKNQRSWKNKNHMGMKTNQSILME